MNVRAAVTLGLAALILSPLARPRGWDDFPISSYPMFSRGDLGAVIGLTHALLVDADGNRTPASPSLVGTPEPMIATAIVKRAVDGGTASELCARIAARAPEGVVAIEVATSQFDTRTYFATNDRSPLSRTVHARCEVPKR